MKYCNIKKDRAPRPTHLRLGETLIFIRYIKFHTFKKPKSCINALMRFGYALRQLFACTPGRLAVLLISTYSAGLFSGPIRSLMSHIMMSDGISMPPSPISR